MDSSSDEDFVCPGPSTSRGRGKQRGRIDSSSSSEPPAKMSKAQKTNLRVKKHRAKSANLTNEQREAHLEKERLRVAEYRRKKSEAKITECKDVTSKLKGT